MREEPCEADPWVMLWQQLAAHLLQSLGQGHGGRLSSHGRLDAGTDASERADGLRIQ